MANYKFISQDEKARDKLADKLDAEGGKVVKSETVLFHILDEDGTLEAVIEDEPDEAKYEKLNEQKKVAAGLPYYVLESDVMP